MKRSTLQRIIAITLVIISILAITLPALAQQKIAVGKTAYVSQKEARLRSSTAITDKNVLNRLSQGAAVKILKTTTEYHGWYRVNYNGMEGFIREDFLSTTKQNNPGYNISVYGPTDKKYNYREGDKVSSYLINIRKDLMKVKGIPTLSSSVFDSKWTAAVIKFQRAQGIKADGIIGPQTKKALWTEVRGEFK